ncbi:MAG: MerR family transcriptional regulator [Coriobacteriales bacterium]|jgi:DNA-binding transcriptional MerR regulator|nr:MerR family transcriptional regulator [Coriobacteriales bacterium]
MTYTIKQLADLAGVSTRTLRWYEREGLLEPDRLDNGYRQYGRSEVDQLEQILFYRELGFELKVIQQIMAAEDFDPLVALEKQLVSLELQQKQTERLIVAIKKTIKSRKAGLTMNDNEKFEAFKRQSLAENEEKYGEEMRASFGEEQIAAANKRYANMTAEQFQRLEELSEKLNTALAESAGSISPTSPEAKEIVKMHKDWLCFFWSDYNAEAHKGLARMYVDDPRFKQYYDKIAPGVAEFLSDAVAYWAE